LKGEESAESPITGVGTRGGPAGIDSAWNPQKKRKKEGKTPTEGESERHFWTRIGKGRLSLSTP